MKTTAHRGAAFTLLELILVLVIIGVLLTLVAPSLRGFYATRRIEDAATHFMVLCNQARNRAVTEARVYRVHLDVQEREYWVTADVNGADALINTELGQTFTVPDNITLTWDGPAAEQGVDIITFRPDGLTQPFRMTFAGPGVDVNGDGEPDDVTTVVCDAPSEALRLGKDDEEFNADVDQTLPSATP